MIRLGYGMIPGLSGPMDMRSETGISSPMGMYG